MTFRSQIRWASLCGALSVAVVLSGCGGGGGGGAVRGDTEMMSVPTNPTPYARVAGSGLIEGPGFTDNLDTAPRLDGQASIAVGHIPMTNGMQTRLVGLLPAGLGGNIDTTTDEGLTISRDTGEPICDQCDNSADFGDRRYQQIEVIKRVQNGNVGVGVVTDLQPGANTDYLAAGVWIYTPDSRRLEDFDDGSFFAGTDPFDSTNIAGLTGEARYQGDASGISVSQSSGGVVAGFQADVELTANFGANDFGTISGRVFNPRVTLADGTPGTTTLRELNLETADLSNMAGGFFTGSTSGTTTDTRQTFTGRWGGQFFGNGDDATDHPTSVGGVFSGSAPSVGQAGLVGLSDSFIGAFGAYKQ